MALTCLQIIQTACKRIGILAPTVAVSSSDAQIIQLVALCEEEGQHLADIYSWQALQKQATFTTVATQVQVALSTITTGLDYIVNDTIWNRSLRRPVYGPKSQQDWQQAMATQVNGPFSSYRVIGDSINFYPVPAVGQACYFEYQTENWISTVTATTSAVFTNDGDTPLLDSQLVTLGLIWRWKAAKGLDYAEDANKYERRLLDTMARDGGKPVLNASGTRYDIQPVVMIPAGSW